MKFRAKYKFYLLIIAFILSLFMCFISIIKTTKGGKWINLGLDLVGGNHLLIKIDTNTYFESKFKNLCIEMEKKSVKCSYDTESVIIGDGYSIDDIKKIDDKLYISGNKVTYKDHDKNSINTNLVNQSIQVIRNRIDSLGTKEINVQRFGHDEIILQIPGDSDIEHIKRLINKPSKLEFYLLDRYIFSKNNNKPEFGKKIIPDSLNDNLFYISEVNPSITGEDVSSASISSDNIKPSVTVNFNSRGGIKFGEVTIQNTGRRMAIVLDDKVIFAPVINEPILKGSASISGNFTTQDASDLVIALQSGTLLTKLNIVEHKKISGSIGRKLIKSSAIVCIAGISLAFAFMLLYYKLFGIVASLGMIFNFSLIINIVSLLGITVTLPGIAGIILTLGMAIDANVLIYEKIKELKKENISSDGLRVSLGFKGAFTSILDSNITTVLAAISLIFFGTSFIKGFAIMLVIGIGTSLFTSVTFTRVFATFISSKRNFHLTKYII
jgi:protein-export membrane protein SecD